MEPNSCPDCGSQDLISGYCFVAASSGLTAARFVPDDIKWREALLHPLGVSGVAFRDQKFHACPECGLLWKRLQPEALEKYKKPS